MAVAAQDHEKLLEDIASAETPNGQGVFWWMGQHTFIVKAGGKVCYIDPFFADWDSRETPPLLKPEEARYADLVLITHGHGDHLDPETLPGVVHASPQALFVCPGPEAGRMTAEAGVPASRLRPVSDGDTVEHHGIRVTAIKSKHETFDEHPTLGFPFLGYVVEMGGVAFYHSGDCILYEGLITRLKAWPRLDAMFLPINGRDAERFSRGCIGNFTYQEVVEIAGEIRPGLVVPSHYDMFKGNQENPEQFISYLAARFPDIRCWVGSPGERVTFP